MACTRHRQEFGEPFDHSEYQRFDENDKIHGPHCKRWRLSTPVTTAKTASAGRPAYCPLRASRKKRRVNEPFSPAKGAFRLSNKSARPFSRTLPPSVPSP